MRTDWANLAVRNTPSTWYVLLTYCSRNSFCSTYGININHNVGRGEGGAAGGGRLGGVRPYRVSESAVRLNLRGRAADGKHGAVAVINSNSNLEHLE